jgi:RNA polymerase sigma-70 factor (ECF subfamily)
MKSLEDRDLAKKTQMGDDSAFSILVDRYQDKIERYGNKFLSNSQDIEDVVQDVFIKAYRNINSFDSKRKFSPWLYRIAHNEFINHLKKKDREPIRFFDPDVIFPYYPSERKTDDLAKEEEVREILEENLNNLEAKYREVLVLYYYEGMTYQEISEVLQIPISTVGVRLKRARNNLKILYDQKEK